MSIDKITGFLASAKLFSGLSPPELERIGNRMELLDFRAGDTVIGEGCADRALYMIVTGSLQALLLKEIPGRREQRPSPVRLNRMQAGEWFGEYALMDGRAASCSVVTTEESRVLRIGGAAFDELMAMEGRMAGVVYRNLALHFVERLRAKDKELDLMLV
ncbi:Crp/Fnr family transcriptional regulator [Endothiovibrio diazotrophicus]